jgi:GT2 family glycosyltransferase
VERFGAAPVNPDVSVIVPLYGRWDFAEIQMSQFANDADFKNVDLIYVVDDPSIYDQFHCAAPNLFGVYQIPFSLAFSGMNLGFSGANNFAARLARARFIILLNSDVLPKHPGWIRELMQIHQSLATPGLLGVKLLFEDGTLQHAGIEFRRYPKWGGMWINDHPFKGQISHDLKGTREVDAVTAACVLIETDLYRRLKGLSEDYIIGDFEDSDLSLAAMRAGLRNYVALDVELYHLERQSQNHTGDANWRSNLTAYNCWLHNRRWSPFIEEITAARSSTIPVAVFEENDASLDEEPMGSGQRSNLE